MYVDVVWAYVGARRNRWNVSSHELILSFSLGRTHTSVIQWHGILSFFPLLLFPFSFRLTRPLKRQRRGCPNNSTQWSKSCRSTVAVQAKPEPKFPVPQVSLVNVPSFVTVCLKWRISVCTFMHSDWVDLCGTCADTCFTDARDRS